MSLADSKLILAQVWIYFRQFSLIFPEKLVDYTFLHNWEDLFSLSGMRIFQKLFLRKFYI